MIQGRIRLLDTDNQHHVLDVIDQRAHEETPPEGSSDTYWDEALAKFIPIFTDEGATHG